MADGAGGRFFLSGMVFLLLTLTNVREQIVNGIPDCLKTRYRCWHRSIYRIRWIPERQDHRRKSGDIRRTGQDIRPQVLLAALGVILIAILMVRRVGSAIFAGDCGDHAHWNSTRAEPLARAPFLAAASVGHALQTRSSRRHQIGLAELIFVFFSSICSTSGHTRGAYAARPAS